MVRVLAAVMRGDHDRLRELWPTLCDTLADKQLLYVPLSKEGDVRQIVAARCRQCQLQRLAGLAATPWTVGGNLRAD